MLCRKHRKSYKTMTKIAINNDTNEVGIVRVGATYNVGNTLSSKNKILTIK